MTGTPWEIAGVKANVLLRVVRKVNAWDDPTSVVSGRPREHFEELERALSKAVVERKVFVPDISQLSSLSIYLCLLPAVDNGFYEAGEALFEQMSAECDAALGRGG